MKPLIKWAGSKRTQANEIIKYFPKEIDNYLEPFLGGGSILYSLLKSKEHKINKAICSDINNDLIGVYNSVIKHPQKVFEHYNQLYNEMFSLNIENKKIFFKKIRERYNKEKNPLDFLWIMRTTTNGLPRYNLKNEFNNSLHIGRDGIKPDAFKKIIFEWSELLNQNNVEFLVRSYKDITFDNFSKIENNVLYLDPPYENTQGMYSGKMNFEEYFNWLTKIKGFNVFMSFDGLSGSNNLTSKNEKLKYFDKHIYLENGISSFKKTLGNRTNEIVMESFYIKNKD